MNPTSDVYVLSGVRTAIGKYGGGLAGVPPCDLASAVVGHPIGATGAILVVKALYELRRTGGRYSLVTMCIGGGQGIAAVFERA